MNPAFAAGEPGDPAERIPGARRCSLASGARPFGSATTSGRFAYALQGRSQRARPPTTVDGRYVRPSRGRPSTDGEGEQVAADVREIYRPCPQGCRPGPGRGPDAQPDRKSTRLNSSHVAISYAVFCLKKKTM